MCCLVPGLRAQQVVVEMILSSRRHTPMPQIRDASTVPTPIPDNSSLSSPVSSGVIAHNVRHSGQDIRQALINLPPFF